MFENVDIQHTHIPTHIRTTKASLYYKLTNEPKGSGELKIGIYCYLTADILKNVLQKCFLSSPLPNISGLAKPLNLICCPTERLNLREILKNHLLRSHKGDKAETLQNACTKMMFFYCSC